MKDRRVDFALFLDNGVRLHIIFTDSNFRGAALGTVGAVLTAPVF